MSEVVVRFLELKKLASYSGFGVKVVRGKIIDVTSEQAEALLATGYFKEVGVPEVRENMSVDDSSNSNSEEPVNSDKPEGPITTKMIGDAGLKPSAKKTK